MTIKKLIKLLRDYSPALEVLIASDEELNIIYSDFEMGIEEISGQLVIYGSSGSEIDQNDDSYCPSDCEELGNNNVCDKCGTEMLSEELNWINSEDFTPNRGEKLSKEVHRKFEALCEDCYQEEILPSNKII